MPRRRKRPTSYYQTTGRPHSGVQNPEKYGLTLERVIELIENGQWKSFYVMWRRKNADKLKKIKRLGYICPRCGKIKKKPEDWMDITLACKECSFQGSNYVEVLPPLNLATCTNCMEVLPPKIRIGKHILCEDCYNKLVNSLEVIRNE